MTFVNEKKLIFHLKYSDSHDKAVAKAKRKNMDEAEALVARRSLVYSGSKFFYKLRERKIRSDLEITPSPIQSEALFPLHGGKKDRIIGLTANLLSRNLQ